MKRSAMSAALGGTGLRQIAVRYGHRRFNPDVTWSRVFLTALLQEAGIWISHKTDKRIKH